MKKFTLILSAIFMVLFISGCGENNNNNQDTTATVSPSASPTTAVSSSPASSISDYFAYSANTKYTFAGIGNEFASYTVYVDYISGNRVQIRKNNGGSEIVSVLEKKDGKIMLLSGQGECYYRENFTEKTFKNPEILLMEPIIKGTSWLLPNNGGTRKITGIDVSVTTPNGKYKTVAVTTINKGGNKTVDYYAKFIGLVKSVYKYDTDDITSSLESIKENTPFNQKINFYYPNGNNSKIYFVENQIVFNTNDITKLTFENAFKNPPKKYLGKLISTNTKIISLYLQKNNVVYVDFSKELVSEMNAGAGFESMILQSITNTLGNYYGVDKVYITVNGKPYSSGHIMMKKGEAFDVKTDGNIEIK